MSERKITPPDQWGEWVSKVTPLIEKQQSMVEIVEQLLVTYPTLPAKTVRNRIRSTINWLQRSGKVEFEKEGKKIIKVKFVESPVTSLEPSTIVHASPLDRIGAPEDNRDPMGGPATISSK